MNNRINISKINILATLFLVVILFFSCEKIETSVIEQVENPTLSLSVDEEVSNQIDYLINTTGIDVYRFSTMSELDRLSSQNVNLISQLISSSEERSSITLEKIEMMQDLYAQLVEAYENNEIAEVLEIYNDFCSICSSIDGYVIQYDNFGIQTIYFDENSIHVSGPYDYLRNERKIAANFLDGIESKVPGFSSLPDDTRIQILTNALYLRSTENNRQLSVSDCENEAQKMLALSLSAATACYEIGLLSCAPSGPLALACCAAASASYAVSVGVAYYQYNRAIKKCRE